MTANSKWWFCGVCGFKNHPRPQAAPIYAPIPSPAGAGPGQMFALVEGDSKCEQCGHLKNDGGAEDVDYSPSGAPNA